MAAVARQRPSPAAKIGRYFRVAAALIYDPSQDAENVRYALYFIQDQQLL
jgi:hypothetical protein